VRDIVARQDIANRDGRAGISREDLQRIQTDLAGGVDGNSAAVQAAFAFVTTRAPALFGIDALDMQSGWSVDREVPGAQTTLAIEAKLRSMSVREKAALMVMEYGATSYVPQSGAIIVNHTHLQAGKVDQLQTTAGRYENRHGLPLLIGADQEGGRVNRLRRMPGFASIHFPSPADMTGMTLGQIEAEGEKTGRGLKAAGVNLLLGPVLDVAYPGSLMSKMGRSFGDTAEEVTERAGAFVKGVANANASVALIAKHFPGYNVRGNSDMSVVTDDSTAAEIRDRARPFFEVEGIDGVMLSSIRYSAYGGRPAVFSPELVRMLRERMPDAVVMTDDLYAASLLSTEARAYKEWILQRSRARNSSASAAEVLRLERRHPFLTSKERRDEVADRIDDELANNARLAFENGVDLLLIMDARRARVLREAIEDRAMRSPTAKAKLDAAVRRLLKLRAKLSRSPGAP
jgi:beta-glucosidase-like glycosyl hydrolase